jgi:hypothetical protein
MILALETRIRELEARLASNSTNSSRPPSSDPAGTARRYIRGELSRMELRKQMRPIRARFWRLLRCGAEAQSPEVAAMCHNCSTFGLRSGASSLTRRWTPA